VQGEKKIRGTNNEKTKTLLPNEQGKTIKKLNLLMKFQALMNGPWGI
jgi:hypothetical protein